MAMLQDEKTRRSVALSAQTVIGRGPGCTLRIQDRAVSTMHAALGWDGACWTLRDLGSRNGTFVDGRRLEPGAPVPLEEGSAMAFGDPNGTWRLQDASAPAATARSLLTGEARRADGGVLALPDDEDPAATLYHTPEGGWRVDLEGGERSISDQEIVVVRGAPWQVFLPGETDATWERGQDRLALELAVSLDEETVEVRVLHGGEVTALKPRAFHYLLLTLARQRLADGDQPESERGWMEAAELARMLRLDPLTLNTHVYRCRKQFGKAGFGDLATLIERRAGPGLLRIGVGELSVVRL